MAPRQFQTPATDEYGQSTSQMRTKSSINTIANKQAGEVRRILRPCSTPGCPELTPGGPCEQHRRARQREHDERPGTSVERGYDAGHRWLAQAVLDELRGPFVCGDAGGPEAPEAASGPTGQPGAKGRHTCHRGANECRFRFDLRKRCDGCHGAKTMRESVRGTGSRSLSLRPLES
jgi:hypothetical protein